MTELDAWKDIVTRVKKLEDGHLQILQHVEGNHVELVAISKSTREIVNWFNTVQSGFRILAMLGTVMKWCTGVLVFCAAAVGLYHTVKTGEMPKIGS